MKNKILFAIFAVLLIAVTAFAASAQTFITSTPVTTATVGQQYTYQMTTNVTGVTYGFVSGPSDFSVGTLSGTYTWMPSTVGTYQVQLSATNNASQVQYQTFNISVGSATTSSGMFEITKVVAKVSGNSDTLTSPGTIDDTAKLDDDIELIVTVRNNFASNTDATTLRNINMDITSDLDDADGLDDSTSRLEAGDHDEMTVSFTLDPENVNPGDAPFDITIKVEGETTNGTIYSDSWTIKLDMDSKSKDLYIYNVEASPLSFTSCNENKVKVTLDMKNVGTKDLDNAAIRFKISDLGISQITKDVQIDSGDDDSFSGYVTIPKGVAPGVYLLEVNALPTSTTNTITSESAFDITVLACTTGNTNTGNTNTGNTGNTNTPTVIVPDVKISGTPVSSAVGKKGLFDSDNSLYLVLLAVLVALLVTVIILLAVKIRN